MKLKYISFAIILVFAVGCNRNIVSAKTLAKNITSQTTNSSNKQHIDTFQIFVDQEIKYYAPNSGSVTLVWKSENYPAEESALWNNNTTLTDGLLYQPMEVEGDTFNIKLKMPVGSTFQYYFWITKNKQGHYKDFWDLQSSGKSIVNDANPIVKNAIYSKAEEKKESGILSIGWLILIFLILLYFILNWIQKKWFQKSYSFTKIEKVLFLGISLAFFHIIARSEIISISLNNLFQHPRLIVKIIRGSLSDLTYVFFLVTIFVLILSWVKKSIVNNFVYGVFILLTIFSTLVAFTNITTVIFLGKPFTYQWLYYSDFLGSNEAKTALQENISIISFLNLISFCISVFVFASVIRIVFQVLSGFKYLKYSTYSIFVLGMLALLFLAFQTKVTWTEGQSDNALTSMIYSMYTANSNSSFYNADIPDEMELFNPMQCTELETPIQSFKEHNVKNILFIILESAGATYFDDFGGTFKLSPNLSRYRKQSLIFDQMYAHAPATNRSLVSILGSIYPFLSYKSLTQEAPDFKHPTISSVLKDQGYRTSFFSSADLRFQNCKEFLAHRRFDTVEDFAVIKCSEEFLLESNDYIEGNGIDDICLADRLTSWIDEDRTKNFFSMIWTVQGHYPYFFAGKEEDFGVSDYNYNRYLNCMKHNDELVGRVMQALEERELASTTLVVVVGDHGEAFGQHDQYGHGTFIYEENLRVPLYFINSELFHGERKSDIASMKDLASTSLSIIGIDIPKDWQGCDLLNTSSNEAFYFAPWSDYLFGYRKDNMKYIFNESRNTVEVFDLSKDLKEETNLFQSIATEELQFARNRVGSWVQFQDNFIKVKLEKIEK